LFPHFILPSAHHGFGYKVGNCKNGEISRYMEKYEVKYPIIDIFMINWGNIKISGIDSEIM
jgi:hypothetical protein